MRKMCENTPIVFDKSAIVANRVSGITCRVSPFLPETDGREVRNMRYEQ
jgi:hypothetical protein